jgi:acetate kinase
MMFLTVNTGSTSVKLSDYELSPTGEFTQCHVEHHEDGSSSPEAILGALQTRLGTPPKAVAHRIVHGGTRFNAPTRLDPAVIAELEGLSAMAPLHNPKALTWVRAVTSVWGRGLPQIGVFDTAFFTRLPRVASEYAIPKELRSQHGVRRYGFHGLAHESMWETWSALHPERGGRGRLITLQLGGGCSIAAIDSGRPMDVSMGFSPLEGLVMATRSGDLDAAIVPYLQSRLGLAPEGVLNLLETQSGLAGLAASHSNPAQLLASESPDAHFAVELYCYRIRKYIGGYLAVLGGCDAITFGGGVGEHVPEVRSAALQGLAWAGIALDVQRNSAAKSGDVLISAAQAPIEVWALTVDEEHILARAAASQLPDDR